MRAVTLRAMQADMPLLQTAAVRASDHTPVTWPAWFELNKDPIVRARPAAQNVYSYLIEHYPRIFFEPQDVKAWAIAEALHIARDSANHALDLLIERRYLLDHGRGQNNVRRVTIALTREAA